MIFPILNGLVSWRRAPITWTLVMFNFMVLVFFSHALTSRTQALEDLMKGDYFISTQGRVYAQYLVSRAGGGEYPPFLIALAERVEQGDAKRVEWLGQLAFRDLNFVKSAPDLDYRGDQVAFRLWKKRLAQVREAQAQHPSFALGLNAEDMSFGKWISYIFVHSGWFHFFGNMLFLMIFGAALERQVGGLGLLVVFLLSGIFAAGTFALLTGVATSPLVGASGAVSGVMSLFCVLNWRRPQRYFYWLFLPFRGFMGFVYLPAWVAFGLWAVNDLAGYLGSVPELGGVAHTAHLGGQLAGVCVGLVLYGLRALWPVPMEEPPAPQIPMGVLIPLLPSVRSSRAL